VDAEGGKNRTEKTHRKILARSAVVVLEEVTP